MISSPSNWDVFSFLTARAEEETAVEEPKTEDQPEAAADEEQPEAEEEKEEDEEEEDEKGTQLRYFFSIVHLIVINGILPIISYSRCFQSNHSHVYFQTLKTSSGENIIFWREFDITVYFNLCEEGSILHWPVHVPFAHVRSSELHMYLE
jgi:hypothetical protein